MLRFISNFLTVSLFSGPFRVCGVYSEWLSGRRQWIDYCVTYHRGWPFKREKYILANRFLLRLLNDSVLLIWLLMKCRILQPFVVEWIHLDFGWAHLWYKWDTICSIRRVRVTVSYRGSTLYLTGEYGKWSCRSAKGRLQCLENAFDRLWISPKNALKTYLSASIVNPIQ